MKNVMYTLGFSFLLVLSAIAQPGPRSREAREKVEQYKIQFLTKEMDLTTEEGQKFWPVYNAYTKDLDAIQDHRRGEFKKQKLGGPQVDQMSDEELKALVLEELNRQERIAQLKKSYFTKFENAVGTRKAALYYRAELEFHLQLMRRLQGRKERR